MPNRRGPSPLKRGARLLARPALSPIDGRVADINRRVESVRASTEAALDAYAESAAESSSYIGIELRRLHDLLAAFGERSFQENYEMRLRHARDLALDNLDEPLAQVINRATGPQGFYRQAGLWFNPPVEVALSAAAARLVQVNERIVEVPFAMAALSRLERGARVLDIGGAESTFALSAASLGYRVTVVDRRPLGYAHPNLESVFSLIEDRQAPPDLFDGAFLISTIGYAGQDAGGEGATENSERGRGADLALVNRVHELLSQDGFMALTVPYGTAQLTEVERTYDEASLKRLLEGWQILELQFAVRRDALVWETGEEVEPSRQAVAMLLASPNRPR